MSKAQGEEPSASGESYSRSSNGGSISEASNRKSTNRIETGRAVIRPRRGRAGQTTSKSSKLGGVRASTKKLVEAMVDSTLREEAKYNEQDDILADLELDSIDESTLAPQVDWTETYRFLVRAQCSNLYGRVDREKALGYLLNGFRASAKCPRTMEALQTCFKIEAEELTRFDYKLDAKSRFWSMKRHEYFGSKLELVKEYFSGVPSHVKKTTCAFIVAGSLGGVAGLAMGGLTGPSTFLSAPIACYGLTQMMLFSKLGQGGKILSLASVGSVFAGLAMGWSGLYTVIILHLKVATGFSVYKGLEYLYHYFWPPDLDPPDVIPTTCLEGRFMTERHPKATLTLPEYMECKETTIPVGFTIGLEFLSMPRSCAHNEALAVNNRQLLSPIGKAKIRAKYWKRGFGLLYDMVPLRPQMDHDEKDLEKFLSRYPKGRRGCLEASYRKWSYALDANSQTKSFVKDEWKVLLEEDSYDPRCISGKHDDYLLNTFGYWVWFNRIAHYFHVVGPDGTRNRLVDTAGLSGDVVGAAISQLEHEGYICLSGDLSRNDGRSEIEALEATFDYYEQCNLDSELLRNLRKQTSDCGGRTRNGVKYSCPGKVCSGVIDTHGSNTFRVFAMVLSLMLCFGIEDFYVFANGDDHLVFVKPVNGESPITADDFKTHFSFFGHKEGVEVIEDYDLIEYCSSRFWRIGNGLRCMGPKPFRALLKGGMPKKHFKTKAELEEHVRGVATGYLPFRWIPFLGHWALEFGTTISNHHDYKLKVGEIEVDYDEVASHFYKLYGFEAEAGKQFISDLGGVCLQTYRSAVTDHGIWVDFQ